MRDHAISDEQFHDFVAGSLYGLAEDGTPVKDCTERDENTFRAALACAGLKVVSTSVDLFGPPAHPPAPAGTPPTWECACHVQRRASLAQCTVCMIHRPAPAGTPPSETVFSDDEVRVIANLWSDVTRESMSLVPVIRDVERAVIGRLTSPAGTPREPVLWAVIDKYNNGRPECAVDVDEAGRLVADLDRAEPDGAPHRMMPLYDAPPSVPDAAKEASR